MNLTIPVPTVTEGPKYAQEIQQNFNLIDSHNHTSGQGALIPLNALTISQNLNMNGYSVTNLKSTALVNQVSSPPDNGSVYMSGNDLYWKDGTGSHDVQITNAGALAGAPGTISGLPTGTASATYVPIPGAFRFQSATNVGADVDCRTVTLRNNVVSSFGMQVLPPSLAANLQVTLPLVPASTKIVAMDSAGAMASNIDADNSSIEIVTNNLQVKDSGISSAKIANNAVITSKILDANVTKPKLAALGQQISSSCGAFSTTSIIPVGVTNLTVSLTTTGRPIMIMLISDAAGGTGSWIGFTRTSPGTSGQARFYIEITGVPTLSIDHKMELVGASANLALRSAPASLSYIHVAGAGTYSISISASAGTGCSAEAVNCKLVAYEL
jgi:hypothetical protein